MTHGLNSYVININSHVINSEFSACREVQIPLHKHSTRRKLTDSYRDAGLGRRAVQEKQKPFANHSPPRATVILQNDSLCHRAFLSNSRAPCDALKGDVAVSRVPPPLAFYRCKKLTGSHPIYRSTGFYEAGNVSMGATWFTSKNGAE